MKLSSVSLMPVGGKTLPVPVIISIDILNICSSSDVLVTTSITVVRPQNVSPCQREKYWTSTALNDTT